MTGHLNDIRNALAIAALDETGDTFSAASVLLTAGFTLLMDRVGREIAVGAVREIIDEAHMRALN